MSRRVGRSRAAVDRGRFQVLLIEDNPEHAELIRRHLVRADEEDTVILHHMPELQPAVQRLKTEQFDAVLCDLRLPEVSSPAETLQTVLEHADDVPIIVLSSLDNLEFASVALQHGAQDYLVKSQLSGALLVRSIRYSIERKRQELKLRGLNEQLEDEVRKRTGYVQLLQDIAVIANEAANVRDAFQQTLNRVCDEMDWEIGQALMLEQRDAARSINIGVSHFRNERSLKGLGEPLLDSDLATRHKLLSRMLESGRPEFTRNLASDEDLRIIRRFTKVRIRSAFTFPVFVRRQIVAMFEFFREDEFRPDPEVFEVMYRIGAQIGRVVERRELEHALEELTVEEQRRINSELHDGIGHELSGLAFYVNSFHLKLQDEKSPYIEQASEILTGIRTAMKELRAVLKGLTAVDIAEDGLPAALSEMAARTENRTGIQCECLTYHQIRLPTRTIATQLYRIAQEAVNNSVKHADADRIGICLESDEEEITLTVYDDGKGIDTDRSTDGLGLGIMKHRASLIGGETTIEPAVGGGTQVCVRIRQKRDDNGVTRTF
jgi:signal transduction histidine kinase